LRTRRVDDAIAQVLQQVAGHELEDLGHLARHRLRVEIAQRIDLQVDVGVFRVVSRPVGDDVVGLDVERSEDSVEIVFVDVDGLALDDWRGALSPGKIADRQQP
jgi:hypothetical protein